MQRSGTSKRKIIQDLELRLGPSFPPKEDMLARNCGRGFPNLITIEDDEDDDVLMYSSNQRTSLGAMSLFPISSSWVPVITEEDLELRLGSGAQNRAAARCNPDGREEPLQTWKCIKEAKFEVASSSSRRYEMEGIKLSCTICMDSMKEETSTVCGHVFCNSCITNAIRIQNRCPTCRKELSTGQIHRIYLPGATS